MQWPMPWTGILGQLRDNGKIDELPPDVREAAERLLAKGAMDVHQGRPRAEINVDVTNNAATVRGYDAMGRSTVQGQAVYEYVSRESAVRVALGAQKKNLGDHGTFVYDGSYIATRLDGLILYAGVLPRWWGPGWSSALSLSTNARPMPQVGFSRIQTTPSQSWLLSWLGPWQFETFIGLLNDKRRNSNMGYVGMRLDFNPLPGLEVAIARHTQMCGSGTHCAPLVDYFTFSNDPRHANKTNEEATIDIRYTDTIFSRPYALYAQFMNEDTNPFIHSGTSKVLGGSIWLPLQGWSERLTVEFTDSLATTDLWGNGILHGFSYNNYQFLEGMRYRGRTLGFSLDSDSRLWMAQLAATDPQSRTYSLSYYRAAISTAKIASENATNYNVLTTEPVKFDAVEARFGFTVAYEDCRARINLAARYQGDQPRPKRGGVAAVELSLSFGI
jgi:hypothetical protein